jgi:uroporphyrinogen-III synthase
VRVLVTRPLPEANQTAARLAALGHKPVIAPLTMIEPTRAIMPAGPFDFIVATSARALEMIDAAALAPLLDRPFRGVGARTIEAARARGFTTAPAAPDVARLLATLVDAPPNARVLYLAGEDRKPALEEGLIAAGHGVETVVVYRAAAVTRLPEPARLALATNTLGAALCYSRRGAELLIELAMAAGVMNGLMLTPHVCISAEAAAPFVALGARALAAPTPDMAGLFAALEFV